MVDEIWKEIEGFGNKYQISTLGRVYNIETGRYLSTYINSIKYVCVKLCNENAPKQCHLHRLLGLTFLPNDDPKNKTVVHHRDHNRSNYDLHNLLWVTQRDNMIKSFTEGGRIAHTKNKGKTGAKSKLSMKVIKIDKYGNEIETFDGISEAARLTGSCASSIAKACKSKLVTHKGFKWQYA